MTRDDLERWLCLGGTPAATAAELAAVLGRAGHAAGGATRREAALRLHGAGFTVAVLRDLFADDAAVRRWLRAPRRELGGRSGLDLLWAGDAAAVEELAVRAWHRPRGALQATPRRGAGRPPRARRCRRPSAGV